MNWVKSDELKESDELNGVYGEKPSANQQRQDTWADEPRRYQAISSKSTRGPSWGNRSWPSPKFRRLAYVPFMNAAYHASQSACVLQSRRVWVENAGYELKRP